MAFLASNLKTFESIQAGPYTADIEPTGSDVSLLQGNLLCAVSIDVNTAGTVGITIQHNDVATAGDAGWANVPADALRNPQTGEADTFDAVTSTDSFQQLVVDLTYVKRYVRIRVDIAGGGSQSYDVCGMITGVLRASDQRS